MLKIKTVNLYLSRKEDQQNQRGHSQQLKYRRRTQIVETKEENLVESRGLAVLSYF